MSKSKKLTPQLIPIKDIRPYEGNERNIPQEGVDAVKKSIKTYGFNVPILVTKDLEIIAGHTRYKALKELKVDEVLCIVVDEDDPKRVAKMRLLDNAISEASSWDDKKLRVELQYIHDISDDEDWGNFASMFPDTSEIDKALEQSVGKALKEVTHKDLEAAENKLKDAYKKSENKNDRDVICPNCRRKFKARVYDN